MVGDDTLVEEAVDASLSNHIARVHPRATEPRWVYEEGYLVLSIGEATEWDLAIREYQQSGGEHSER
jgi:hypothetical protein